MNVDHYPQIFVLPGCDKRVVRGHPWAYANEIRMDASAKALTPGTLATLHRVDGKPLGVGTFNPHALIAFRVFARDGRTSIDRAFLSRRLAIARALRERLFAYPFYRLIHGEADGLPGLVVDRFGETLSVQTGTAGMEGLLPEVLAALDAVLTPTTVVLRNDGRGRTLEGLESHVEVASGSLDGPVEVQERNLVFQADLIGGQKTGWFYDQRENRAFVASLAKGVRMLDVYCYGGGFAVSAAAAKARTVVGVDSSEPALELARITAERNGVAERCTFRHANAFSELSRLDEIGERFDLVTADPPAFVKSRKDLRSGLKGYRKLATLAARLVASDGILFLASCSHNVTVTQFADEVVSGIAKAGRTARIIRVAGAAPDHPVHPHLPESAYLKAMVFHVD